MLHCINYLLFTLKINQYNMHVDCISYVVLYPLPWPWLAVKSLRRGLSTNPGVIMWCLCGFSWRDDVCVLQRGYSGDGDVCGCRCSCMGSISVSSCRCCMFVYCVYPVAVLHDLHFVNAGRGCKRQPYGRGILQSRSHDNSQCVWVWFLFCCWMLWMCLVWVKVKVLCWIDRVWSSTDVRVVSAIPVSL